MDFYKYACFLFHIIDADGLESVYKSETTVSIEISKTAFNAKLRAP